MGFEEDHHQLLPPWLEALHTKTFFDRCSLHAFASKNEKNICCLDCCASICPHCIIPCHHRFHSLLQIRRYVYHDVVQLDDLEKLIDCSNVQPYTLNSAKVVFIKKRPQNGRQFKGGSCCNYCTSCQRTLQQPYIHCSLACKVGFVLKHYKDISVYLRECDTLQLGPDFFIPDDNKIMPHDEPMSWSEGKDVICTQTQIIRKKRSGLCFEDDMATSIMINRRKGVPHRSPLC